MQFTTSAAALLALVSSVLAQTEFFDAVTFPTRGETLQAGQTYSITWDPTPAYDQDTVTIRLMQGRDEGSLDFNPTNIADGISSSLGTYSWTVDSSVVGFLTYGLKIQLDKDPETFQYSDPFQIAGDKTSSTTSAPISSTASTGPTTSASPVSSVPTTSSGSADVTTSTPAAVTTSTSSDASSGTLVPTGGSGNASATGTAGATAGQTTLTTASKPSSTGPAPSSTTTPVQTAGAGKMAAGTLAAIGGIVAAVLAL